MECTNENELARARSETADLGDAGSGLIHYDPPFWAEIVGSEKWLPLYLETDVVTPWYFSNGHGWGNVVVIYVRRYSKRELMGGACRTHSRHQKHQEDVLVVLPSANRPQSVKHTSTQHFTGLKEREQVGNPDIDVRMIFIKICLK
jgi:hypothetical protein